MRATPSDLRVLTPLPIPEPPILCAACQANNCTEPATATDPAGEGVCQFHATHCDCGHRFSAAGVCRVCDASACPCSSDEFARPGCAVHGKAV